MPHSENFNIELFNALHPSPPRSAARTLPKPGQEQLHFERLNPKLRRAIDLEAVRRGQKLDELVPELLRLGLKALRQGNAPETKDRENHG